MPGSGLTYAIANPVAPFYFLDIPVVPNFNFTADTINLGPTPHNFVTGNHIWFFFKTTGATVATSGGISALRKYFVIVVNSTTIKLANSLSNATNNVAIDITDFALNVTSVTFMKINNGTYWPTGVSSPPEFFPAYAKSEITFNSDVPVEINFTIPAYTSFTDMNFAVPIVVLLRNPNSNACWGAAIKIQNYLFVYNGVLDSSYGITQIAGSYQSVAIGNALTAGYNQKYVITPSKTIECWYGQVGGTMTLYFTTTPLAANTQLKLEFGSNFTFCRMTDCNIKYL